MQEPGVLDVLAAQSIRTWYCETEGAAPDWWCQRWATLLGRVGNEQYFRCGACDGIFRTGAA